jgi:hypothetical protein
MKASGSWPPQFGSGLVGALLGLLASFAFSLGLSLRACLPDRPELFWLVTFEFWIVGFVFYVPAMIAGFFIGCFVRPKRCLL